MGEEDGSGSTEQPLAALDDICMQQREDPTLRAVLATMKGPEGGNLQFRLKEGVLYRTGKVSWTGAEVDQLVVPQPLQGLAL